MPSFKPFTSFFNQGMQNTNQNINNINQPQSFSNLLTGGTQPFNQNTLNSYSTAPPGQGGGGGQLFGDPGGGIKETDFGIGLHSAAIT